MNYYTFTFGCQMNEHDSEILNGLLEERGYEPESDLKKAGLILINTCCIRTTAEEKVFGLLGRLRRQKSENPGLIIGVCGCMPGLALTDLLARVFRLLSEGRHDDAFELFQGVLPQIVFSLQSMELFHHAEKLLLQARGVLPETTVREATTALSEGELAHAAFLNEGVLALLDRAGLPRNPVPAPAPELTRPRP